MSCVGYVEAYMSRRKKKTPFGGETKQASVYVYASVVVLFVTCQKHALTTLRYTSSKQIEKLKTKNKQKKSRSHVSEEAVQGLNKNKQMNVGQANRNGKTKEGSNLGRCDVIL